MLKHQDTFKPIISVIIPVYNVENYLNSCVQSLINQTFKSIEFIFIDDASTDSSGNILDKYKEKYPERIVVIHCKENGRQGRARNIGIEHSRGNFIGFVDADDFVLPDMYRKLYEEICTKKAEASFCSAIFISPEQQYSLEKCYILKSNSRLAYNVNSIKEFCNIDMSDKLVEKYISTQDNSGVWTGLYRKELIEENNIYFPEQLRFEDNYWVSLLRCYLKHICIVDDIGYCYRYNPKGSSKRRNCDYYDDRSIVECRLLDEVKKRNLLKKYYFAWEYLFANRCGINTCLAYITRFDEIPYKKIEGLRNQVNERFPNWRKNPYFNRTLKDKLRILIFDVPLHRMKYSILYKGMRLYYEKLIIWHNKEDKEHV